jgi:hypothetical protein
MPGHFDAYAGDFTGSSGGAWLVRAASGALTRRLVPNVPMGAEAVRLSGRHRASGAASPGRQDIHYRPGCTAIDCSSENRRRLANSGPSSLAYSAAGRNGAGPTRRTPRERCIPATAKSSRDTLAIGESAWARGWVDGAGPSARLRLDLKLVRLGHRSPQPAAVTAAWPGPCGLARSLQPDRAPQQRSLATAALVGHCSSCGSLQRSRGPRQAAAPRRWSGSAVRRPIR